MFTITRDAFKYVFTLACLFREDPKSRSSASIANNPLIYVVSLSELVHAGMLSWARASLPRADMNDCDDS